MKFKKLLVYLLLVVCVLTVSACGKKKEKKNDNPIVGKWALGSFVYTFNNDNTCSYDAAGTLMKCTYKLDGDKIAITYDGNTEPFETTYEIKGNKLIIKDSFGSDTVYEKK